MIIIKTWEKAIHHRTLNVLSYVRAMQIACTRVVLETCMHACSIAARQMHAELSAVQSLIRWRRRMIPFPNLTNHQLPIHLHLQLLSTRKKGKKRQLNWYREFVVADQTPTTVNSYQRFREDLVKLVHAFVRVHVSPQQERRTSVWSIRKGCKWTVVHS